jgi:hypothetical protein
VRARNIKPSICDNEVLGTADPLYTLLFERLWMIADRRGRLEDRPLRIKAQAFPYRAVDIEPMLEWLETNGFIARYTVKGSRYIQVIAFDKHQKPHKNEQESVIPSMDERDTTKAVPPTNQGSAKDALIPDSGLLIPDSGLRIDIPPKAALSPEFADFLQSTYPECDGTRSWTTAVHNAAVIVDSGRATEADLRTAVTGYRAYRGQEGGKGAYTPQKFFALYGEDLPWQRPWKPPKTKAQVAQDSNVAASVEWLRRSDAAAG